VSLSWKSLIAAEEAHVLNPPFTLLNALTPPPLPHPAPSLPQRLAQERARVIELEERLIAAEAAARSGEAERTRLIRQQEKVGSKDREEGCCGNKG
jgi:hypothetical protein